jgi:DNA-directed RNA polymerase subunit H (RpoH/RPB5)
MASSQTILSLFNSRKNIIELLGELGFIIEDYESFSINEIDAMNKNAQMDMLIYHKTEPKKAYIKYVPFVRQNNLEVIVDDLFCSETVLDRKNDILILISDDEPNEMILSKIQYLYDHDGIFVIIHNIKRLQFNIRKHVLTPSVRILTNEEELQLMQQYKLRDKTQLPEISRFDPLALAICMKPQQICEIKRSSTTALETLYYRVCV